MKETTFISKRLTLTKEERPIAKSWANWWTRMGSLERRGEKARLLFGNWSGYSSSQSRITHVDYCYYKDLPDDFHGTVRFTDGTTMAVWVEKVTRAEVIRRKLRKNASYSELISKLIKSGKSYYNVADESKAVPA
jgi:hypothetical protein